MVLVLLAACTGSETGKIEETAIDSPSTHESAPVDTGPVSIVSVTPSSGPVSGGTLVELEGIGLIEEATVLFGDTPPTSCTHVSDQELWCVAPAGPEGRTFVTVDTPAGHAEAGWTWLAETVDTSPVDTSVATSIASCSLLDPFTAELVAGEDGAEFFGTATIPGRTETEGEPIGVDAAWGYGKAGSDPEKWAWTDMYWDSDGEDGASDVWHGWWYPELEGTYDYGVRFRTDHNEWVVCPEPYGTATVSEPETIPVDYCEVHYPCSTSVLSGQPSEDIYAWIYQGGSTDGPGEGPDVLIEIGIGPDGSDPLVDTGWTWYYMSYNTDKDGLLEGDLANDEYVGNFYGPSTPGTYIYAARATVDDGASWTACDLGGSTCGGDGSDSYDPADAGICTVD